MQSNILIRDGSIVVNQPDGKRDFWWMGEPGVSLLQLLAQVCSVMSRNFPEADFTITDTRTPKVLPDAEDNRVDLTKAA